MIMTGKTISLRATVRRLDRPEIIVAIVVAIFALAGIASYFQQPHLAAPVVAVVPTPAIVVVFATAPAIGPTAGAQVAQAGQSVTHAAIVAFSSPNGQAIGAIEAGRRFVVVASFGAGWLQADVDGSGRVWLRASELLGTMGNIPDLEPSATPVVERQPIYVPAPAFAPPTPAPAPTEAPATVLMGTADGTGYQVQGPSDTVTGAPLDQADPQCTGAANGTIAAGCGLTPAQLREAEQR